MIQSLTKKLRISPAVLSIVTLSVTAMSIALVPNQALAQPLMTKTQYTDYSVSYQCAEVNFHDDLSKKEEELIRIEDKYGLNDDNFDAFDDLITEYERDDALLDNVRDRVSKEC